MLEERGLREDTVLMIMNVINEATSAEMIPQALQEMAMELM